MTSMKRFGVAALFAIGVALLTSSPALAELRGTIQLTNTDAEPGASGTATLTRVELVDWMHGEFLYWESYKGYLTVTCRGLTPGAEYWTPAGTFKADRYGNGMAKRWTRFGFVWWWEGDDWYGWWVGPDPVEFEVDVVRQNRDGSSTLVLTGAYPYY